MKREEGYKHLIEQYNFPLVKANGKKPIENWKKLGVRNYEEIGFNKNHNACIITGRVSGLIVLDIDHADLFHATGYEIPDTFTVQSGKGFHHYFKFPADEKDYRNRSYIPKGFDIRANGVIVAPYSTHPETKKKYRIINEIDIAEAPDWLLKLSLSDKKEQQKIVKRIGRTSEFTEPSQQLTDTYKKLMAPNTTKGQRSEKLWLVLRELVQDNLSDEEIYGLFESYPDGAGEKYYEKGGARIGWLLGQIDKIRQEFEGARVKPFKASNQLWVEYLHKDIIKTFTGEYGLTVSEAQSKALEQVYNLFIGLLDNEYSDWYCIPLGVGSGKTEAIKHLIRFLHKYDTDQKYSIALSLEKISEINDVNDWLLEHGVSTDYFQIVHNQVDDLPADFKSLKDTPVVIHTHYKLKGISYLSDYFLYRGKQRSLMIFDESMLNSMTSAQKSQDVATYLDTFLREYSMNHKLKDEVPGEIYQYFSELASEAEEKEKELRGYFAESNKMDIQLPAEYLIDYEHPELIRISNAIQNSISAGEEDISIFRDLLLLGKAPEELRQIFIQQDEGNPVLFTMKEVMSSEINNLVTTDASREIRSIFHFSERPVKIYDVEDFKLYDNLSIHPIEFKAGLTNIKKYFQRTDVPNPYLLMVREIVKLEKEHHNTFLIFHSKQLTGIRDSILLDLIRNKIILPDEESRFHFETFGRENATNQYKDCGCIIFLGLHYKPKYALKALLLGETKDMGSIAPWMLEKVNTGELTMQLQQGSGRGTIRDGDDQSVYFCAYDPSPFNRGLQRAFPGAEISPVRLAAVEQWKQKYGVAEMDSKRKVQRTKDLRRACKKMGLSCTSSLMDEFLQQEGGPMKYLKDKGYKKVV